MRGIIALILMLLPVPLMAQDVRVLVETAADGSRTVIHEIVIPAKPSKVWRAVATAKGWQGWAVPLIREIPGTQRFETNYDPSAAPGAPSGIEQEWIERDAPRKVSFRTVRTPSDFPHSAAYLKVVSSFTLTPEGKNATRVRLIGVGYPEGLEGDALIGFFKAGNKAGLQQLHSYFISGPIDWGARGTQNKEM